MLILQAPTLIRFFTRPSLTQKQSDQVSRINYRATSHSFLAHSYFSLIENAVSISKALILCGAREPGPPSTTYVHGLDACIDTRSGSLPLFTLLSTTIFLYFYGLIIHCLLQVSPSSVSPGILLGQLNAHLTT